MDKYYHDFAGCPTLYTSEPENHDEGDIWVKWEDVKDLKEQNKKLLKWAQKTLDTQWKFFLEYLAEPDEKAFSLEDWLKKEKLDTLLKNVPRETPDNTKLLELIEKYGESKWVAGLSGSSKPIELLDKIKGLLK